MNYNVITFYGKNDDVYKVSNDKFDDIKEAVKFIKESNSEYDSNKKHWSISMLADDIKELEIFRSELDVLLLERKSEYLKYLKYLKNNEDLYFVVMIETFENSNYIFRFKKEQLENIFLLVSELNKNYLKEL